MTYRPTDAALRRQKYAPFNRRADQRRSDVSAKIHRALRKINYRLACRVSDFVARGITGPHGRPIVCRQVVDGKVRIR